MNGLLYKEFSYPSPLISAFLASISNSLQILRLLRKAIWIYGRERGGQRNERTLPRAAKCGMKDMELVTTSLGVVFGANVLYARSSPEGWIPLWLYGHDPTSPTISTFFALVASLTEDRQPCQNRSGSPMTFLVYIIDYFNSGGLRTYVILFYFNAIYNV